MAGHFDCIGVSLESPDDMVDFINRLVERTSAQATDGGGDYYLAEDPSGALVSVNVSSEGAVECVKPSFDATSSVRAVPRELKAAPECRFCDRLYLEVLDEDGELPLVYPLAVELHDIAVARDELILGEPAHARLVGFAEQLETWPDKAAFDAQIRRPPLGASSVIVTGLFVEAEGDPPEARALITGTITASDVKTNEWTGGSYRWARIRTYGGEYEILAAMDTPAFEPGAIAQAGLWIVGTIAPS